MKSNNTSVYYLGTLAIMATVIFSGESHAQNMPFGGNRMPSAVNGAFTTTASESDSDSVGLDSSSGTSSSSSSSSSSADATVSSASNSSNSNSSGNYRDRSRRKNKRIFYLGVCVGQTLAKQGTYLSDIASGATSGSEDDFKSVLKAAISTCKSQANSNQNPTSASPTPSPSPASTTTSSS